MVSLATGYTWVHKNIRLLGYSMAGITTSIAFPEADAVFDIGQGLPWHLPISNILLTHGHMDHASGVPYLIGQKAMAGQTPPNVYMPVELLKPMRELMRIWERIEDHTYQYQFLTPALDREYKLKPPYFFKIFPTFHRVPSLGYTIFERRKRLKDQYKGFNRDQLIDLRRNGIDPDEQIDDPIVSFTGDTRIEFLDACPWVRHSRILLTETTFVDKTKTVENARHWGHLHFDELLTYLPQLRCEKVVLIHVSARYTTRRIQEVIEKRVPEHLKTKLEIFPRPI